MAGEIIVHSQDETDFVDVIICPNGHKTDFLSERDFLIARCMACNNLFTLYQRWECPFCAQTETLTPSFAVQLCEKCDRLMVVGGGFDDKKQSSIFFLTHAEQTKFLALTNKAQWQEGRCPRIS